MKRFFLAVICLCLACLCLAHPAFAGGDAPAWMHQLASKPLPAYDEKTDAVLLYSETNLTVVSTDKIKIHVREAYKILRPNGREHGVAYVHVNPHRKVTSFHGWCIPAQGKDFEVKDKDSVEVSPSYFGGELISDVKVRTLTIPAPDPGNIVGYEYEVEEQPLMLEESWDFQESDPVLESRFTLQLPSSWEYKASWINHAEISPTQNGAQWEWDVKEIKAIRHEAEMPPLVGVAGQMVVSFFPPGGSSPRYGFANWQQMGDWYRNLSEGRRDASPQIRDQVATLVAGKSTTLQKMQAIAEFVQHDIRYVAVEIGIGGWQPHTAAEIYSHRYGDCKDKSTLMGSMLHEIGIDSYYVLINTRRGVTTATAPAHGRFNHAIIAIKIPEDTNSASLIATVQYPRLGKLLFFDPTNDITPFGELSGDLQANYGLLVTPQGGELTELPQQPSGMNSIQRTATLTLTPDGNLHGDVKEVRLGDRAASERWRLRNVKDSKERIKPIEEILGGSLSSFQITKATLTNLSQTGAPFGIDYSFVSDHYAKNAGGLLLVRPRVLGEKAKGFLETREPRLFPVEFEGPVRDTDRFEIAIPAGYTVDDLPPPVDADYGFASYHSKTEVKGNVIGYTRTFEVKELSVPVEKTDDLKKLYRIIATDERNTVVLKEAGTQ